VVFHPLAKDQILGIAKIQLRTLVDRVRESDICLQFEPEAMALLAEVGYDPVYGARPLKRAIQRLVENPLAQEMLAGHFAPGDRIVVARGENDLEFRRAG